MAAGAEVGRPEVLMINRYVELRTATGNIASALGFLALLWSTVVLLGGFIDDLLLKEFWVLTALSFLMSFRMAEITDNELSKGIYMEEDKIIETLRQQKWFEAHKVIIMLRVVLVLKWTFAMCFILLYHFSPFVNLGVSVWRLVRRDYGDAGGDAAKRSKLNAALDIFYGLILFQSLFAFYYVVIFWVEDTLESRTKKHCGLGDGCASVVRSYYRETIGKFRKNGELPANWNLITYGVELLQSASGDDHLRGAWVLYQLFDKNASVRKELLSSTLSIQNLIGMIGLRGTDNIKNRERAARIVAHLASDLNIAHFPGTLQCICSMLESCNQFCETCCPLPEKNSDEQSRSLQTSQRQDVAHMAVPIEDQTDHEQEQVVSASSAELAQRKRTTFLVRLSESNKRRQQLEKAKEEWIFTYTSRGPRELVSQGLLILEGLTQDKVNCTEISKQQVLLSKITSPLNSPDFLNNVLDYTMVEMLGKSLTVVSRLLTCPGDGATRLRQELASTTEAVSNLMAILETDSGAAQEVQGQALEILTELAFDDSFKKLDFNKLFKALLCIFLEEAPSNNTIAEEANNTVVQVEQADRENATRLMGKAGEALARLLPISTATERDVNVADIISKEEAINLLTKVLDQILSSQMGTSADAAENFVESQPQEEPDSIQPHTQGDEKQSEERKFMEAMLSLAVVICHENVIIRKDFARSTPEDAALVKKLKEILKVNKQCTAECLRVVKLTCQMVVAMIQAKPSCIQYFNEHNFKEALTETLGTMSEVDNCLLFAGNDREVIKPARSLASLVKEAQVLLSTAQEQGN